MARSLRSAGAVPILTAAARAAGALGCVVLAATCSLFNREGPDVTCAYLDDGETNECSDGIIASCVDGDVRYEVCGSADVCAEPWQRAGQYKCDAPAGGQGGTNGTDCVTEPGPPCGGLAPGCCAGLTCGPAGRCCYPLGAECAWGTQCCDGACHGGKCACPGVGEACGPAGTCCAGITCDYGECCADEGAPCSLPADCCTFATCHAGRCCRQHGMPCLLASDCCAGANCSGGYCGCMPAAGPCGWDADCCSGKCSLPIYLCE
jgi:hypothetical protein